MDKGDEKSKKKIEKTIVNMIDEGSEKVTTLSKDTEAKYESIAEKVPGEDKTE